jgi:hypothetical protein
MKTVVKSRLIVLILSVLLLCTTVPSTTSCESAVGTAALGVVVIAVVIVSYAFIVLAQHSPVGTTTSACADPCFASIGSVLPELVEQRQDFVIRNELDCAYEVYVDGAYRCDVGPLAATSLDVGVGTHEATLYLHAESGREPEAPRQLNRQFEVIDDEGFAYAVIQYSY